MSETVLSAIALHITAERIAAQDRLDKLAAVSMQTPAYHFQRGRHAALVQIEQDLRAMRVTR